MQRKSNNVDWPRWKNPRLFGILTRKSEAKFGNSLLGKSTQVGSYIVAPVIDAKSGNIIAYNAGRGTGNFGLGSGIVGQATAAGLKWVGKGY